MYRCIVIISFLVIFSSCANKSQSDLVVLRAAEEGLEQSSRIIYYSTEQYYKSLEGKLVDPQTAQQAFIWQPVSLVIKQKSEGMISYLELLINKLKTKENFREDDIDAVRQIFVNEGKGDELYNKLKKYKEDILGVNPRIAHEFGKTAVITTKDFETSADKQDSFTKKFFSQTTRIGAIVSLRRFENNVRVLENEFVTYCNNNIGVVGWRMDIQAPLITQSSNLLKLGDKIKIVAGIGAFSSTASPLITINGKVFKESHFEGFVASEIETPNKPGKYFIPVKIEYSDNFGKKQVLTKNIEYTVVE